MQYDSGIMAMEVQEALSYVCDLYWWYQNTSRTWLVSTYKYLMICCRIPIGLDFVWSIKCVINTSEHLPLATPIWQVHSNWLLRFSTFSMVMKHAKHMSKMILTQLLPAGMHPWPQPQNICWYGHTTIMCQWYVWLGNSTGMRWITHGLLTVSWACDFLQHHHEWWWQMQKQW